MELKNATTLELSEADVLAIVNSFAKMGNITLSVNCDDLTLNTMSVRDESIQLVLNIPKREFITAELLYQCVQHDCVELYDVLVSESAQYITLDYLVTSNPSKRMLKLYLDKKLCTAEQLIHQAKIYNRRQIMKDVADIAGLSAEDVINFF